MSGADLVVVESRVEAAATCIVCGKEIPADEGVTARFRGQTLRFKCPGCLTRFKADPDRFLSGGPSSCCDGEQETATRQHVGAEGAASTGAGPTSAREPAPRLVS